MGMTIDAQHLLIYMLNKKHVTAFLGVYALVRVFSFFFGPETPLQQQTWLNTTLSGVLLAVVAVLLFKKRPEGWYLIALEIILGGGGNFLNFFGVAVRTCLLALSMTIFFAQKLWERKWVTLTKNNIVTVLSIKALLIIAIIGAFIGLSNNHARVLVLRDLIPYAFLLYYFPLRELLKDTCFTNMAWHALVAAVIGNGLLTFGTLLGYSTNLFVMQDSFYHWFRDVAGGKITELPFNYYRIVLNEHLLLIPLTILFVSKVITKEQAKLYGILAALSLLTLSTNLTRIYFIALAVGLLALVRQSTLKRWFLTCSVVVVGFMAIFISLHTTFSRGQSLGLELFGLRLQSIVTPAIEDSSLSRLLLLPKIKEKIALHPIIGNGLGDTIAVYSPVFKKVVTTPHYDWGYFEVLGELGVIGFIIWGFFIGNLFFKFRKKELQIWQFGSLLVLLVINITSPAVFHVLGIIWLSYLLAE